MGNCKSRDIRFKKEKEQNAAQIEGTKLLATKGGDVCISLISVL
jgi:hypothetical protein